MSTSKRLVASFIQFLQDQVSNGLLSADSAESLEVGIQCLETAFELQSGDSSLASATPLQEIFEKHLQSHEKETVAVKQEVSPADKAAAEDLKAQGNTHMTNGDYQDAIDCYTKAIELDPTNAVYYCNRCAVHNKLENFQAAIEDANKAIQIDPSYSKAYGRLGLAYTRLRQYQKAVDAYQTAYDLEPDVGSNSRNLQNAQDMLASHRAESGAGMEPFGSAGGLGGLLGSPAFMSLASRMASHPEMRSVMNNLMTGNMQLNSSGDIDALIQVGHELAQQMRSSNPTLVDELRRQMEGAPSNRGDPAPDAPPK